MKMREKQKLNKIIEKHYFKHKQNLYITSLEVFDKESCALDIYLCDENGKHFSKFLFTIINYKAFYDLEFGIRPYNTNRRIVREIWDSVKASCSPYYFDRTFTLYKFTSLTKQDIENACRHLLDNILKNYFIFNIVFIDDVVATENESLADKLLTDRHNNV